MYLRGDHPVSFRVSHVEPPLNTGSAREPLTRTLPCARVLGEEFPNPHPVQQLTERTARQPKDKSDVAPSTQQNTKDDRESGIVLVCYAGYERYRRTRTWARVFILHPPAQVQ